MLIGINNSVLYLDYLQNVNNKVIPYCFFYNPRKALAQFDPKKVMFYTIMERGRHMIKKKRPGLAFTITNKYHTNDKLYNVIESPIIAHHT